MTSKSNEMTSNIQQLSQSELITRLTFFHESNPENESWRSISDRIGISSSIVSQWLKKSYSGNNKIVNIAVERFLRLEQQRSTLSNVEMTFVEISNSTKIMSILNTAHADGIIAAIVGDTGTSKTVSIKQYINENNVLYLHANRSYRWPVEYLRQIHRDKIVGKSGLGTQNMLMSEIIEALKGKTVLIIVDQADYLNLSAIDLFRTINDEAHIGVVFVGLPGFLSTLSGDQPEVRQVRDRIKRKLILKQFTQADANAILDINWPGLNGIREILYHESQGSVRRLANLLYNSKRLIESENAKSITSLDEKCIKTAAAML